eukprot:10903212-Heterocapsa_arctica.AAC.1
MSHGPRKDWISNPAWDALEHRQFVTAEWSSKMLTHRYCSVLDVVFMQWARYVACGKEAKKVKHMIKHDSALREEVLVTDMDNSSIYGDAQHTWDNARKLEGMCGVRGRSKPPPRAQHISVEQWTEYMRDVFDATQVGEQRHKHA